MTYSYRNELFLSNNYNYRDTSFRVSDVTGVVIVKWLLKRIPQLSYFIRQRYYLDKYSFTTLKRLDFIYKCREVKRSYFDLV